MAATSISNSNFSNPNFTNVAVNTHGAPDVPTGVLNNEDEISKRVHNVSSQWKWSPVDSESLGLIIPHDQDSRKVSKEKFVSLLEFCEDSLDLKRVIAVFDKNDMTLTEGFPRTLRYIGFRVVAPDLMPASLDSSRHFAMAYAI